MPVKVKICLGLLLVSALSCRKLEEIPPIPAISLESLEITGQSALLTLSFTDGDGDLGLSEGDTLAPFNFGSEHYANLKIKYYELQSGMWVLNDSAGFEYRIPNLTPEGQIKTLEGTIEVAIEPFYFALPSIAPADTFRYAISLFDRALQESNVIETEALTRP